MIETQDLISKIREVVIKNVSKDGAISLEDIFGLVLSSHSLCEDTYQSNVEDLLAEEISLKIHKEGIVVPRLFSQDEADGQPEPVRARVQELIGFMRSVRSQRIHFREFG